MAIMEAKEEILPEKPVIFVESPEAEVKQVVTEDIPGHLNHTSHQVGANNDNNINTGFPFAKWLTRSIRKKTCPAPSSRYVEGWPVSTSADYDSNSISISHGTQEQLWEDQSVRSSLLGTVKTTTISLASLGRSRRTTHSTVNKSNSSEIRGSMESSRQVISASADEAARHRSIRRWQVLQEIVTTETDYVCGLKALTEVLYIFQTRLETYRNIEQILDVHQKFLAELLKATPKPGPTRDGKIKTVLRGNAMDFRFPRRQQNNPLQTRALRGLFSSQLKEATADPYDALDVANKIEQLSKSFAVYEKFCSNYELLSQDVAFLRQSVPDWQFYDQGIEALSKSTASIAHRMLDHNKSMTFSDLLIKPIQRVCKYPLLLQDLLKNTPISDCPTSHYGIEQVLEEIKGPVTCINSAAGNPILKDRIQKTILLQEKLDFTEYKTLHDIYKQLGPMNLCGVLHVTYALPELIVGEYMVCALFKGYLFLARLDEDTRRLQAVASFYIPDITIESVRNGKGISCYECLFSWKLIFPNQSHMFELIISASSAIEERQWKTEILEATVALTNAPRTGSLEPRKFFFVGLNLTPLDRTRPAVPVNRRSFAHSGKVNWQSIIIKKTDFPYNETEQAKSEETERVKAPTQPPPSVISTKRSSRIRLESFISDMYTRDVLPFPAMLSKKNRVFLSGETMKRRLTIRPNFTRRPSSSALSTLEASENNPIEVPSDAKQAPLEDQKPDTSSDHLVVDEAKEGARPEGSPASTVRSRKSRYKGVTKESNNSDVQPGSECNKGHRQSSEAAFWKNTSISGLFNSLSKKMGPRPGLAGLF